MAGFHRRGHLYHFHLTHVHRQAPKICNIHNMLAPGYELKNLYDLICHYTSKQFRLNLARQAKVV